MENISRLRGALARIVLKLTLAAAAFTPVSSQAVWDYSIGAQVAMLDSLIAYCGKVEKGMAGAVGCE